MNENRNQADPSEGAQPGAREPYERPCVVSEQAFETLALTCGKTDVDPGCVIGTSGKS